MASRNFLGFFGTELGTFQDKAAGGSAGDNNPDEIELGLGLSLGGRFGTDPARDAKRWCLARPSSVASTSSLPGISGEDLATAAPPPPPPPLHRTSSLPVESDEARLRRKAMQRQRRLAAKRKLLERRTSMNSSKSSAGGAGRDDAPQPPGGFELRRSSSSLPEQGGSGSDDADADANSSLSATNTSSDNSGVQNNSLPPASSSGTAEPPSTSSGTRAEQRPSLTTSMRTASTGDFRKTLMMEEMPMVFSRLEGANANARRVDGFLYRFATAPGDVRIVCVCHGRFLTPAEFVQHAGGGADDLAHPLRHIVVNRQQPSEFL